MRENGEHIPGVPASPVAGPASDAPLTIQEAIHAIIVIKPGSEIDSVKRSGLEFYRSTQVNSD